MNYRDVEMVNQSLGNLGDTLLKNRMMQQESQRYNQEQQRLQQNEAATQDYRQKMLANDVAKEKWGQDPTNPLNLQRAAETEKFKAEAGKASAAKEPIFRWKGQDGVQYEAPQSQFGELIQAHPASPDKNGENVLEMEGETPSGVKIHQKVIVPKDNDESHKTAASDALKSFVQQTGIAPKQKTQTEELIYPGSAEVPAVPASTGVLGVGASPAVPAIPAKPKRIIRNVVPIGDSGMPNLSDSSNQPTPASIPAAQGKKVPTLSLLKNLKSQGMDKTSAAQWLQDNGYTIQ